jgi:hypothetical protein
MLLVDALVSYDIAGVREGEDITRSPTAISPMVGSTNPAIRRSVDVGVRSNVNSPRPRLCSHLSLGFRVRLRTRARDVHELIFRQRQVPVNIGLRFSMNALRPSV